MKKFLFYPLASALFIALLLLSSCNGNTAGKLGNSKVVEVERVVPPACATPVLDESLFTNKVYIEFSANGIEISELPAGVSIENGGKELLLRSHVPGVEYIVGGFAADASLTVVSDFSPLVTLDALSLTARGKNALQVSSKELIYVRANAATIADVAGEVKADNQSAALKLMGRALLCGGALSVNAERRSAVFCTDTLYLGGMQLSVGNAPNNALMSNKAIIMSSGAVSVSSAKDVIKSKQGDIIMLGGALTVSSVRSKADGLQANNVYVAGGNLSVTVTGEASDGIKAKKNLCIAGGNIMVVAKGGAMFNSKKSDYSSASCLKSDAVVDISGGCCNFVSEGDGGKGVSCDSLVVVSGGVVRVLTKGGDMQHPVDLNAHSSSKGIKSDGALYFLGGNIEVAVLGEGERSEGVEAKRNMYIGGDTRLYVYAYDDALNAADLTVAGGRSYLYSVANDAVDSNGTLLMSGGVLVADGSFDPEQGVDVDDFSAFCITGGTLLSVGGSMGPFPALPLGDSNSVPVIAWSGGRMEKDDMLSFTNDDGSVILAYRIARDRESAAVLVASPQLEVNGKYALSLVKSVEGAEYVGNGLYSGGSLPKDTETVAFETKGLVNCVSKSGDVSVVEPGNGPNLGMMPSPPPPMGDSIGMVKGKLPPPPPPMRRIKSEYCEDALPNYDYR